MTRPSRRIVAVSVVFVLALATVPLAGQFAVYDPANYAEAVLQYEQLIRQYEFLIQQAQRLPARGGRVDQQRQWHPLDVHAFAA